VDDKFPSKGPSDRLDYGFDFTAFLATCEEGTVVNGFTVTAEPDDLAIDGVVNVNGVAKFWASGGTTKTNYVVTCVLAATSPSSPSDPLTREDSKTLYVK
jgi:hypothetical protein